jgi:hypothetical protein
MCKPKPGHPSRVFDEGSQARQATGFVAGKGEPSSGRAHVPALRPAQRTTGLEAVQVMEESISSKDLAEVMAAVHAARIREEALACELASSPLSPEIPQQRGDAVQDSRGGAEVGDGRGDKNNHHATASNPSAWMHKKDKGVGDSVKTCGRKGVDSAGRGGHADVQLSDAEKVGQDHKSVKRGKDDYTGSKRGRQARAPGLIAVVPSRKMLVERQAAVFGADDACTFEEVGLSKVCYAVTATWVLPTRSIGYYTEMWSRTAFVLHFLTLHRCPAY